MRLWSLLRAQTLEARRNPTLAMLPGIVLVLALVWKALAKTEADAMFFTSACLLMCTYTVGFQFPSVSMAEEREKRTLEAILLTPARPLEVITSRALLAAAVSTLAAAVSVALFQTVPANAGLLWLGFLLSLAFTVTAGLTVGLVAPDQKTAGVLGAPIMIVLLLGGVMPWEQTWPEFWAVQAWMPTRPAVELIRSGLTGEAVPVMQDVAVLLVYLALVVIICSRTMRRLASTR